MNNQEQRLQKYLARCGIASRRHCEEYISSGRVSVNDKITTKMGTKIDPKKDVVKFDGKIVRAKKVDINLVLNKPAGYVSTMKDPQGRPCVANLVPVLEHPSLFPVGRLDRLTSGMLIFTTDGSLGQQLLHPKHEVEKCYELVIDGKLNKNSEAYKRLCNGVEILSGKTSPAKVKILEYFAFDKYQDYEKSFFRNSALETDFNAMPKTSVLLDKTFTRLEMIIHEGKNRQIRRMLSAVGFEVLLLTRISIGKLKLDNLECGKWRKLKSDEVKYLLC